MSAAANAISSLAEAHQQNAALHKVLADESIDFVDFGCSVGGSMLEMQKLFPGSLGLGVDIDDAKIEAAKAAGHFALVADARYLRLFKDHVRFSVLSHFLEHLPSVTDANLSLLSAAEISTDFIYVRQPNFDADGYLFNLGYKTYWSDWHGHPNRMSSLELFRSFDYLQKRGSIQAFEIFATGRIRDSQHSSIHPLASPQNQNAYDETVHPEKPLRRLPFFQPVYSEIHGIAQKHSECEFTEKFAARYPDAVRLYSTKS
ncbi:MAG: class I SAM-dependent methyltransferase [Pseudomonadota bacterium]|jgi:hypothetical protein|nr:class I SAM-dependent methyltransferase [Pseudomonadota bacterium]